MSQLRKFYFAGAIRGGRQDAALYRELINYLQNYGKVLTEHIGLDSLKSSGEKKEEKFIHDRDIAWLSESDEVTTTSMGVGYEIGRAFERDMKVLCLFRPIEGKVLSSMIRGADNGKNVVVKDYTRSEEAKEIIKEFLSENELI